MNKKHHTLKYILLDFFSAGVSWVLFNNFRKNHFESIVYGYEVKLEFGPMLFLSTVCVGLFWVILYYFSGYYNNIYRKSRLQEFSHTFVFTIIGVIFLFFTLLLDDVISNYKDYYYSFITLFSFHFFFTYIPRNILTTRTIKKIRKGIIGFNTLIIGSNSRALELLQAFPGKLNSAGCRFVGFINVSGNINPELSQVCNYLGQLNAVERILEEYGIEEVIVAIETNEHKEIEGIVSALQRCKTTIKIIPDLFEILIGNTELSFSEGTPLLYVSTENMPVWEKNLKLLFDKVSSVLFLTLFSPLYLFTALGVRLSSEGPIIYKQKRVGLNGKEFYIYKFRSMYKNAELNGPELSSANDKRVTKFGQFMRRSRLDEIPQFYNVLKGDMSIVGPRPERKHYIEKIVDSAPEYTILLKTKPGITSLGQVKFGYAENVEQMIKRLKYDIIYMKNMSMYLDLKILIFTILTIVKGDGK
jgi:exopolysaccharide biosynthesis polyprenyl glycosylphosphotransferase